MDNANMRIKTLLLYLILAVSTAVVFVESFMLFMYLSGDYIYGSPSGYSMSPVIEHNDFVVYEKLDSNETVEEGDIVMFTEHCAVTNDTVVHTVKEKHGDRFITQGANNTYIDQYEGCMLPRENIRAEVAYVFPNPVCDVRVSYYVLPQICQKPVDLS